MDIEDIAGVGGRLCCSSSRQSRLHGHPGVHIGSLRAQKRECAGTCANPCRASSSSPALPAPPVSSRVPTVVPHQTGDYSAKHDVSISGGSAHPHSVFPVRDLAFSNPIKTLSNATATATATRTTGSEVEGTEWDNNADDVARQDNLHDFDVVVIGAGVVGCAIARELVKRNTSVVIIERGHDVAQGASKANSGIVHGGYDARHGTVKGRMAHRGNEMFGQLERELHFGFSRCGSLVVGFSDTDREILEELISNGNRNGVRNLVMLNGDQVRQLEPNLNKNVTCALFCPHTGIASPYEYTIALAENAVDNGAQLMLNHEVVAIERGSDLPEDAEHGGFVVRTERDNFHCKVVINAAGLYSDKIAAMVGANNFSIVAWKGEYILLNKTQGRLLGRVVFQCPDPVKGKGVLVSPTFHGNLLIGPTSRGPGSKYMTNKEVLQLLIHTARKSVPDYDIGQAITSYSGLRAKSQSRDFIIEESEKVPGFFNVAGIDSPGLTSSPAIAKYVVSELLAKAAGRLDLDMSTNASFNPFRPAIIQKKSRDFPGRVDVADPAHNIICRCERVTESEIVSAMGRSLRCDSIDSVKKRTRAGMGPCQGTFCEPRVVRLIAKYHGIPESQVHRAGRGTSLLAHRRVTAQDRVTLSKL